ncbi:alpha/beta fold hydrolase [Nigerium massiliense]|uniref:alpha/beta fold hydrolase n=1 Tax=Nigerium massiliense TaxID=1522317 RepID=UPI0005906DBB|nr:alpha/beta hydrolase [Nigerium massiliense]
MPDITVPGESPVKLHYTDTGGDGRPVVLIHGWPLSGESWAHQTDALESAGHRVVTYDRRGFGRSDQPGTGNDYDTLSDDLAALLDQLDLRDAVIVGFSMGGGEVARYIGKHGTDRLAGAVLAAAVTPALAQTDSNPDGAMPQSGFEEMQEQCRADREGFLKEFMTTFFSTEKGGLQVSAEELDLALDITEQAEDTALVETIGIWGTDLRADLEKCDVPLLVIHGDSDQNVPFAASGQRVPEFVPQAKVVEIAGGPHGINVSHAHQFNVALLDFLRNLS